MKVLELYPTQIFLAKLQFADGTMGHTPVLVSDLGEGKRHVMTPRKGHMQMDPAVAPLAREVNDALDCKAGRMPSEDFEELDITVSDPPDGKEKTE